MNKEEHISPRESQQISLRVEHYDDIFSDFDVRPYSHRALSRDFVDEIKRAANDKYESGIELILYVPASGRDESEEKQIGQRLMAHFNKHFLRLKKEKGKIIRRGLTMVALGIISMFSATYLHHQYSVSTIGLSFLLVFLEPVSIFLLWEGLDQIIFSSKNVEPELDFYRKMSRLEGKITFKSDS